MMKKQKGMTLVEVMVATVIFVITFAVICSTYLLSVKGENKQRVYIHFESMCLDIDAYSEEYGLGWGEKYFGKVTTDLKNEIPIYFDAQYNVVDDESNAFFVMNVKYENRKDFEGDKTSPKYDASHNEMVLSVKDIKNDYFVIDELIYGSRGGRFEKDYVKETKPQE